MQSIHNLHAFLRVVSEEAIGSCSMKKLLLKIMQNSQKNTCTRTFFNKDADLQPLTSLKIGSNTGVSLSILINL